MSLTLRCRGPGGQSTLTVGTDLAVADFLALLSEKTGIPSIAIEVLTGFPPKPLQLPAEGPVSALGLTNGDTLTVRQGAFAAPITAPQPSAAPAGDSSQAPAGAHGAGSNMPAHLDEDEMLARAIAASLESPDSHGAASAGLGPSSKGHSTGAGAGSAVAQSSSQQQAQPSGGTGAGRSVTNAPAGGPAPASMPVAGGEGSCVVRRVIDSDNSCLFNAVGYVMDRSRHQADELRKVVARQVAADPVTFNDGFLGKEPEEYCRWIQQKENWGGAIELFILAQYYGREIAAFDIQTKRCDVYGQDKGYGERALLIYDGLHYDALAVAAFEGAPEELDVTMFALDGREAQAFMAAAEQLVAATHAARQFTDTANFTLRCGVCQIGIKGEKEAVEHAKATGHTNFSEY